MLPGMALWQSLLASALGKLDIHGYPPDKHNLVRLSMVSVMAFTKGVLDSADLCSGVLGQDREQKSAGSYFLLEE